MSSGDGRGRHHARAGVKSLPSQLRFLGGLPGFPGVKVFSVKPWGAEPSPFAVLDSQDVPGLRFVSVIPAVFFPAYAPDLGADVLLTLGIEGPEDIALLVILTLGSRPDELTANLLGPIVVNVHTGEAVQAAVGEPGPALQTRLLKRG